MPPHVAVVVPLHVLARTTDDEHLADVVILVVGLLARLVDGGLERRRGAASVAAVGGDDHLGVAVLEPAGQRVGGEPAEHHGVRGAEARAGEHRDHGLGDHRHVDRDPVTGLDAELDQRVGGLAHLVLELGVGDVAGVVLGLADPVEGDLVAGAVLDVPVDAVVGGVDLAADEPLGERRVVPVEDLVPLGLPVETLGLLLPEGQPVLLGLVVRLRGEVGVLGELVRRLEPALLVWTGWPGCRSTRRSSVTPRAQCVLLLCRVRACHWCPSLGLCLVVEPTSRAAPGRPSKGRPDALLGPVPDRADLGLSGGPRPRSRRRSANAPRARCSAPRSPAPSR